MVHDGFSIPSGAVLGEGSGLQQHVCCESSEHFFVDWKVFAVLFILGVLHVDDELIDAGSLSQIL